ncbi:hypothetical protein DFAR_2330032 [Desulfarculales bacterium]
MYESLDKPTLKPLPATAYQYIQWKKAKVHIDYHYHVEVDRHYYSAPHQWRGKKQDIRYTERTVECFYQGQRVASHRRILEQNGFTTLAKHMPRSHQEHAKWDPRKNHQLDTQNRRGHGQSGRGDHGAAGTSPAKLQGLPKPGHPDKETW